MTNMKHILPLILLLTCAGCMSIGDIYIPAENKTKPKPGLSALKAGIRARNLNIDGVGIDRMANWNHQIIYLTPGTHTLKARIRVGSTIEYDVFAMKMKKKGYELVGDMKWQKCTGTLCQTISPFGLDKIVWKGWEPVSITFDTEAGKSYLLPDLLGAKCKRPSVCW